MLRVVGGWALVEFRQPVHLTIISRRLCKLGFWSLLWLLIPIQLGLRACPATPLRPPVILPGLSRNIRNHRTMALDGRHKRPAARRHRNRLPRVLQPSSASRLTAAVGVARLREVPALCAAGVGRAGDPLGRSDIERQATAVCSLYRLRPQERSQTLVEEI